MRVEIRLAHPDDRLNLIEVQRRASLASETGDVLQKLLEQPELFDLDEEMLANNEIFVAEVEDRVVGFATIIAHEGNDAELEGLFVEPTMWRKGVGTQLLHAIEREAAAWGANRLHVLANLNVLGFYTSAGFSRIGEKKTDLGPIAWLMAKPIVPRHDADPA